MMTTWIRSGAGALVLVFLAAAPRAGAAERGSADPAAAGEPMPWTPTWLGVPDGLTFDVQPNAELGQTFLFVRFAEAREGPVTVTVHDVGGAEVAALSAELDRGSAMLLWDGRTKDGEPAPAGRYAARMICGDREAGAEFPR